MKYFFTIICVAVLVLLAQGMIVGFVGASSHLILERPPGGEAIPDGPESGSALVVIVQNVTNWVFIALLLTASIFIIFAAFQYLTGGGDPTAVSEARRKLMYAAIAVVVGTLAKAIPLAVRSIAGA